MRDRNLLQASASRNDGIRCFLVNERLSDRVIGLFLLIQKKKKRILTLRQNSYIDLHEGGWLWRYEQKLLNYFRYLRKERLRLLEHVL